MTGSCAKEHDGIYMHMYIGYYSHVLYTNVYCIYRSPHALLQNRTTHAYCNFWYIIQHIFTYFLIYYCRGCKERLMTVFNLYERVLWYCMVNKLIITYMYIIYTHNNNMWNNTVVFNKTAIHNEINNGTATNMNMCGNATYIWPVNVIKGHEVNWILYFIKHIFLNISQIDHKVT